MAKKLTTGPRGAVFLAERELGRLEFGAAGAYGKLLSIGVRSIRRLGGRRRHEICDISFASNRVVDIDVPGHDIYIAIAFVASRVE